MKTNTFVQQEFMQKNSKTFAPNFTNEQLCKYIDELVDIRKKGKFYEKGKGDKMMAFVSGLFTNPDLAYSRILNFVWYGDLWYEPR